MKKNRKHIVVMVGTSEQSVGGITSVIKLIQKMPVWEKYSVLWLETQVDGHFIKKAWWVIKAACTAPFVIAKCKVVHFQMVPGITLMTQFPALLAAKLFRKPVIASIHVGNQLEPYSNDYLFKFWLRRANIILLLARHWEILFKKLYIDVKVPTGVLYNACEIRPYRPMSNKQKLILFVGTIHENKAPDLLLKAWSILRGDNNGWRIAFLGTGDIAKYSKMAESLRVSQDVSFTGYLTGKTKEEMFENASIFCMCSYMEGFPMAVLEAWSNSIAVVTTPVGGLPDAIEEGNNCLTFPMGDYHSLASQLKKLIENEELRQKVAVGGYYYAKNHYSLEVINNRIDTLYSSFITGS